LPDLRQATRRDVDARLDEAAGLAEAIGIVVEEAPFPHPPARAGDPVRARAGRADRRRGVQAEAELLIVDAAITPIQQKNLEDRTKAKVIDRTGLILEIFGERAATGGGPPPGRTRPPRLSGGTLVRSWTHLERQRGGFGFLGGPGETQIEADRRLIRDRMAKLKRELEQVSRTRTLHRARRQRAPWPVIALVGYTNAGKSTLFNRLTRAEVLAEDLLFATLDPTMREIAMPGIEKAILSDTVGFISDLPTQLVAAFRATLEEVVSADLIVHVRDISHADSDAQREDVERVLEEIGASPESGPESGPESRVAMIEAWNKIDVLEGEAEARVRAEAARRDNVVVLSALSGEGGKQPARPRGPVPAHGRAFARHRAGGGGRRGDRLAPRPWRGAEPAPRGRGESFAGAPDRSGLGPIPGETGRAGLK
jgi:GTP-binding protein HflX